MLAAHQAGGAEPGNASTANPDGFIKKTLSKKKISGTDVADPLGIQHLVPWT